MVHRRLLWIVTIVCTFGLVLFLYTFLHEGGHALVGMLFGGKITDFNLNFIDITAHVGIDGEFNMAQNALISVAGVGVPLLLWAILISTVPRTTNPVVELFKLAGSVGTLSTLLAWVIIPIVILTGTRPGDDSANFLGYTGIHPLAESAAALLLYVVGFWWYLRRAGGLQALRRTLQEGVEEMDTPRARRALGVIGGLVVAALALGTATGALANGGSFFGNPSQPPEGFELLSEVDLSQKAYDGDALGSVTLAKDGRLEIFVSMRKVDTDFIALKMLEPDGKEFTVFQSTGYRASADRMQMGMAQEAGEYRFVLSGEKAQGVVGVYVRTE